MYRVRISKRERETKSVKKKNNQDEKKKLSKTKISKLNPHTYTHIYIYAHVCIYVCIYILLGGVIVVKEAVSIPLLYLSLSTPTKIFLYIELNIYKHHITSISFFFFVSFLTIWHGHII